MTPTKRGEVVDGQKVCTKCRELLPVAMFRACKTTKSGLQSWCKGCTNQNSASWHQRNKPKRHAQKRAWYKAHTDVLAAQKRRSYARYRERITAYARAWYQANATYARAYSRAKWRANKGRKPKHLLRFLVELTDQKACAQCHRLKQLFQFDRDARSVDGYSKRCLECLPPRKTPREGYLALDQQRFDNANAPTFHESVADQNAADPEEVALQSELWEFVDTLPANQKRFLMVFLESLDLETAASECNINSEDAGRLLSLIRTSAFARFESEEQNNAD